MLRDIREWFELQACILASLVVHFCGIYWLLVVGFKFFAREPLLYVYDPGSYTQETVPVAAVLLVHLIAIGYQLLTRTAVGRPWDSFVLQMVAPKVAFVSTAVLLLWANSKTADGASPVPLAALAVVSTLGAILMRRGPLIRGSERLGVAAEGSPPESEAVARVSRPRRTFAQLHGCQPLKERLLEAAGIALRKRPRGSTQSPRNDILLHGQPGNGKTIFVEALAGELRLPLLTLTYSDVASKWVGERTDHVRAAFQEAMRRAPCVFFLDEVDSFLETRDLAGAGSVREDRDLVNAMLTLLVQIREHRVLVVAATNHLARLDAAAIREGRFDFKIEVPPPDLEARLGLLQQGVRAHLPHAQVPGSLLQSLATRWNGYSTKRLLAVVEELPRVMRKSGRPTPEFPDFMEALRSVQGRAPASGEPVRPLRDLVLSERTRVGLSNLLARMQDPLRTESLGGTLPCGVVFHGEPGTGKTVAAKALARESGWTILATSGADLTRDLARLGKLHADARELRPAIVFIDEADEILRDRRCSLATEATNKLLTILDGAEDRTRDVVWIAATNDLHQADPAMLRGGRFSEKIVFELPSEDALAGYIADWVRRRRVRLEPSISVPELVERLGNVSIVTVDAVMQAAVNLAIEREGAYVYVGRDDVLGAIELVIG